MLRTIIIALGTVGFAAAQWKKLATEHAPPGTAPCVSLRRCSVFMLRLYAPSLCSSATYE